MIRKIFLVALVLAVISGMVVPARGSEADVLIIKGIGREPSRISVEAFNNTTKEAVVLKPYKMELNGIKSEIEIYRNMYLVVSILIMGMLIDSFAHR